MSDTSGSGFGKFVPGFEFLQNLAGQAAGGGAQGLGSSMPQLPNLSHWVAPTVNVEDLEKRIEELKAVHFWLDQNTKALSATIQALEVQKMTLATLQQMNFSFGDVANALKIKTTDAVSSFTGQPPAPPPTTTFAGLEVPARTYGEAPAPSHAEPPPAPVASAPPKAPVAATAQGGVVDPVQWWGALSQQFQNIAANAMKDVAKQTTMDPTQHAASGLTENVGTSSDGPKPVRAPAQSAPQPKGKAKPRAMATPKVASKPAPKVATAQPLSMGDWPLPAVFFPGFQAPAAAVKPVRKSASAPAPRPASKKSVGSARKKPAAKASSGRRAPKS